MKDIFLENLHPFLEKIQPLEVEPTGTVPVVSKNKSIKAVIFDIYGTLIISSSGDIMQSSYDASMFANALKTAGYKILVNEDELMRIHTLFKNEVKTAKQIAIQNGTPFPELNIVEVWERTLSLAVEENIIEILPESNLKLFVFVFELNSNKVWPMPSMHTTIALLRKKNIPLGIVSNAQFYTPIIMNYFLYEKVIDDEFIEGFEKDISVFSYKILKGKPDTAIYKELLPSLEKRRIKPSEVLYVGNDMLKDIYASSRLGFTTCFYAGDMRAYRLREDHPEASKCIPNYTITDLKQLLEII